MKEFKKLGISNQIIESIKEKNFSKPTFIQAKTIPLILEGKDVVGQSATGSGKTLAFGCGLIQHIEKGKGIQGIVLTPTRELAEQVSSALKEFSSYKNLNITPIYGGVSINPQISNLRRTDIVVATPGRMLDHMERRTINLSAIKLVVLDEADRMLDMGFIDDVKKIVSKCPKKRQTLLFSATISRDIINIKDQFMNDPEIVKVDSQVDPTKLHQEYFDVKEHNKFSLLVTLLDQEKSESVMVFCNTRRRVDILSKNLHLNGVKAVPIHGGFTQAKRSLAMERFQSKKANVLVCTDVAARGLDIRDVTHVYNYDLPKDSKDYVHRIGRTARAGKNGKAINLLSNRDHDNFSFILREYPQITISKSDLPQLVEVKMVSEKRNDRRRTSRFELTPGNIPRRRPNNSRRNDRKDNRRDDKPRFGSGRNNRENNGRNDRKDNRRDDKPRFGSGKNNDRSNSKTTKFFRNKPKKKFNKRR